MAAAVRLTQPSIFDRRTLRGQTRLEAPLRSSGTLLPALQCRFPSRSDPVKESGSFRSARLRKEAPRRFENGGGKRTVATPLKQVCSSELYPRTGHSLLSGHGCGIRSNQVFWEAWFGSVNRTLHQSLLQSARLPLAVPRKRRNVRAHRSSSWTGNHRANITPQHMCRLKPVHKSRFSPGSLIQATASESNVTVERPTSKAKTELKKEIYKGLEDSPAKVEMCCIVDEENNVVGQATRAETVGNRLWGRGVYCLVQNRRGQLLVTQRTEDKDLYPGHLDVVVSGCVNVGEEYSDTIVRELSEELGLQTVDRSALTPLFLFKWVDEYCRIWGCGYHYVTDCETFDLQVEEVQWCKWMDLDQVEELIRTARFTPVGLCVLRRFLKERQTTWSL